MREWPAQGSLHRSDSLMTDISGVEQREQTVLWGVKWLGAGQAEMQGGQDRVVPEGSRGPPGTEASIMARGGSRSPVESRAKCQQGAARGQGQGGGGGQ